MSFLDVLTKDNDASTALDKLQRAGCDQERLFELVTLVMFYKKKRGLVPDDAVKALKRLPNRIKGWADELERIPAAMRPVATLARVLPEMADEEQERVALYAARFENLPSDLRFYAELVQAALPAAGKLNKGFMASIGRQHLLELVAYVREKTGRPRFAELSAILVAAAHALEVNEAPFHTKRLKDRVEHLTEKRPRK